MMLSTLRPLRPLMPMLAAALLALAALVAIADDSGSSIPAAEVDPLGPARTHIANKNWDKAIAELRRVKATTSADWNNLMGYSLRQTKAPDLAAAERFYDAALRIDPRHRGALEYSGELYLMLGQLARAEQRLAALRTICAQPCEEHADLLRAIDRYKASGGR